MRSRPGVPRKLPLALPVLQMVFIGSCHAIGHQHIEQWLRGIRDTVKTGFAQLREVDRGLGTQSSPAQQGIAGWRVVEQSVQISAERLIILRPRSFRMSADMETGMV